MAKIAIDMDGVLADFVGSAIKITQEEWGIDLPYEEVKEFRFAETIKQKQKDMGLESPSSNEEIYGAVMRKGVFRNLKPMPYAIQAVQQLVDAGHEITVLTKALSTNRKNKDQRETVNNTISEKLDWLHEHLGEIPYNVIMVSDMNAKGLVGTHIIVDDDPRALEHPTALSICVAHPWNEQYRQEKRGLQETIDCLSELPEKVALADSCLNTMIEIKEEVMDGLEDHFGIERSKEQ